MSHWINHCELSGQIGEGVGDSSSTVRKAVLTRAGQLLTVLQPGSSEIPKAGFGGIELMAVAAIDLALSNATDELVAKTGMNFAREVVDPTFKTISTRLALPTGSGRKPMDQAGLLELAMVRAEAITRNAITGVTTTPHRIFAVELIGEQIAMEVLRKGAKATATDFSLSLDDLAQEVLEGNFSTQVLQRLLRDTQLDRNSLARQAVSRATGLLATPSPRVLSATERISPDGNVAIELMGRHGRNRAANRAARDGAANAGTSLDRVKAIATEGRVSSC